MKRLLFLVCFFVFATSKSHAQPLEIQLDELVFTGSMAPDITTPVAANSFVIPQKTIEKRGNLSIADLLREVPGFAVSSAGANNTQIRIRGGEGNHTLILIDGVEARGGDGEYFLSGLTAASVERIEVLRGPQTLFHGAGASSGVINIITKQSMRENSAFVQAGSTQAIGGTISQRLLGIDTNLSLSKEKDTGYDFSGSDGEKDTIERDSLYLTTNMITDNGFEIGMKARYAEEHYKFDEENQSATNMAGYVVDNATLFADRDEGGIALSTSWYTAEQRTRHEVSAATTHYAEKQNGAKSTREDGVKGSYSISHALDDQTIKDSDKIVTAALGGYRDKNSLSGGNNRSGQYVAGEFYQAWSQKDIFSVGIKHATHSKFKSSTDWKLSSSKGLGQSNAAILFDAGTGVTHPSYSEINGNASWGITGNENLVPEQNNSLSIGVKFSRDKTADYLRVVGFNELLKNEIVYVSSGATYANETSTSRRRGVEIDGSVALGPTVISGAYTYLIAKNKDGTIETRRPRHSATASISYTPSAYLSDITLSARHTRDNLDTQFWGSYATKKLPNYTVFNLTSRADLTDSVSAVLEINNITDKSYQDVWGFASRGRSGWLKIETKF
ncbi:MAG: TonB-dependent receptor plug domain-containing protein [Candidatus Puniceispirillaceae bacterium]